MFGNFKAYFNMNSDVEYDKTQDVLTNFFVMFGGQSFRKGLFRVLPPEYIDFWADKITTAFPKFADKFCPFAYDWQGRFYCIRISEEEEEPAIYMFNIGHKEALLIPVDLLEFLDVEIPEYSKATFEIDGFNEWIEYNPPIEYDECVGYITPVFLGGEDNISNLQIVNMADYWDMLTDSMGDISYTDKLLDHYESFFGIEYEGIKIEEAPINGLNPEFCVVKFPATQERELCIYATLGMSSEVDETPVEIYMYCVAENDRIVSMLYDLAYHHKTVNQIVENYTIEFGYPWYEGSNCDCGLISPPYIDGPEFEECGNISCLWLIPVTKQEVDFKLEYGLESLEQKFSDVELNYMHYFRDSAV